MGLKSINEVPNQFSAGIFVHDLLEEGSKCSCDDTSNAFNNHGQLPPYYDKEMYRRGQRFFNDNILALLYGKFLGLLSLLAIPRVLTILAFSKKSGSPLAAYRRYLSTVLHMCVWYRSDFVPGSGLWRSLMAVKTKHNFVSRRCSAEGLGRITQKDMALTQFGFMGFAVLRPQQIGLHDCAKEDLEGFVHVWRVIGHAMGIEDRFNICRDDLEETREICRLLAEDFLKPVVGDKDGDFIKMATYLADGMWSMNPTLNAKVYLNIVHGLLDTADSQQLMELSFFQHLLLRFILFIIWSLQFPVIRSFWNYTQYVSLWLMRVFPFLAYYQFGYSNSYVRIL